MPRKDARTLPPAAQEEKRRTAIALHKQGKSFTEVGSILGVHYMTVSGWWTRYQEKGEEGLRAQRRGRRAGEQRTLNAKQEAAIRRLITNKTPDQLQMSFALWTRTAVRELIKSRFGITMPVRTVGHYLKRWGFTPQKPLKRAYEQRPAEIARWLKYEYPRIAARAKSEGAEIHWGDETGLSTADQRGRGFAPKGKTPVMRVTARRSSIGLISTVTNQGKVRFMVLQRALTTQVLILFMKRLIKDADRKVFLILDNLRVHHAKAVRAWLEKNSEHIEVFYLPSYAPELNPDEYLNGDLKVGVAINVPARDKSSLKKAALSHLRMLQKRPSRVRKYFEHPAIRYAA